MDNTPQPQETLAEYIKRIRTSLSLSQNDLAVKAGIHLQSLGKIERGVTTKINQKSQRGLAVALQIPPEYLDAVARGIAIVASDVLKFCPHCWQPGTGAMRFCEVLKIRVLNHLFRAAIAVK